MCCRHVKPGLVWERVKVNSIDVEKYQYNGNYGKRIAHQLMDWQAMAKLLSQVHPLSLVHSCTCPSYNHVDLAQRIEIEHCMGVPMLG